MARQAKERLAGMMFPLKSAGSRQLVRKPRNRDSGNAYAILTLERDHHVAMEYRIKIL
jgi:hypothetical protein